MQAELRRTPNLAAQDGTGALRRETKAVQASGDGYTSLLQRYVDLGLLTDEETELIGDLFTGILNLSIRAHDQEPAARNQLNAIRKLTFPEDYKLPIKDINKIANKYETKAYLAQGARIREMMAELSWAVVCVEHGKNVLSGKVKLCTPEEALGTEGAYDLASRAFRRLRTRTTTLELLAISVLRHQESAFKKKSVRHLRRALRLLEEWEQSKESLPQKNRRCWQPVDGGPPLLIPSYTEGWKRRKKGSGGDRKDNSNGRWEDALMKIRGSKSE
jgi:hypothetical protein